MKKKLFFFFLSHLIDQILRSYHVLCSVLPVLNCFIFCSLEDCLMQEEQCLHLRGESQVSV